MFHLKGCTTVAYKQIFILTNPNPILDLKPESKYLLFQNIMEALNGDLGNMGTRAWFISGGTGKYQREQRQDWEQGT